MRVRVAVLDDAPGLAEVHVAAWQAAYRGIMPGTVLDNLSVGRSAATWRRLLGDPGRQNLVCDLNGAVIGFVAFGPSRDEDTEPGHTGEIYGIYVDPKRWGQGAGWALWQAALQAQRAWGKDIITLWVYEANDRARAFYERIGFLVEPKVHRSVERYGVIAPEVRYRWPARAGQEEPIV